MLAGRPDVHGGDRKVRNLNDAGCSPCGPALAAAGALFDTKGFTGGDLRLLQEAHRSGIANRGWGRGQFAANAFSHYLAIWDTATSDRDPPTLVIVRFDRTGTYALLVQGRIVANGKTLAAILPALAVAASTTDES